MPKLRLALLIPFVVVSFLFVSVRSLYAFDEWQPVDPADLKMTSEPKAPGASAIYLYRQVDRKDAARGSTEYNYLRIKILTEEGRRYANVEIPFFRKEASITISNVKARCIRPDGTVVNFDGKFIDKMIEKTKGEKVLARTFSIPDVQVGSIVEYHFNYDYADNYIFNSYWLISDELFTRTANFSLKPYPRWYLQWSWPAGLPVGTKPPAQDPDGIVRMTSQSVPAFEVEDYMPPANELKFRVLFTYSEEGFEQDTNKFWQKIGKKQNDHLENFLGKHKDLEQAVSQIVSPSDAPEVKLRKIYARVQQFRNLSYEPFKTQQEEKREIQKPVENAADILKYGYGYGSQLTWLFVGLARAAGFDASGALVSNRDEHFFNEKLPDGRQLNSNVAIVTLNGKDLYFDPGSAFVPYGLLPWQETNSRGVKLNKGGGSWIQTPNIDSAESEIQRNADLKLTEDGALEGKVTLTFTGLEACWRRAEFHNQDDEARKKYLEDLLKQDVPTSIDVDLTKPPDWVNGELPLSAEFQVKIPGWVSSAGRRAIMPAGVFSASEKHMFEHAHRVNAVYFRFPFRKIDSVSIELPSGWKVDSIPKDQDTDAKAAEYIFKVEKKPNAIKFTRIIRVDLAIVPKEAYSDLRNFYQLVKSNDEQQIVLLPGAASASN
jgi:Domain of Unknown Function with PDB structure (DUF3857)